MRKLSKINEDIFNRIQRRNNDVSLRKEDSDRYIHIDKKRYYISDDLYDRISDDEQYCLGFKELLPEENMTLTTDNCAWGEDKSDLGHKFDYDVFAVKEFTQSNDKTIKDILDRIDMSELIYPEIQNIVIKYIKKLFTDNHMSELAEFSIYEMWGTDWVSDGCVLYPLTYNNDKVSTFLPDSKEYPKDNDLDILVLTFPAIDDWSDEFTDEIVNAFTKLGWSRCTEEDEDSLIDPYNGPSGTCTIAFVDTTDI